TTDDSIYGEARPNTPEGMLRQLSKLEPVPEKPEIYGVRIPNHGFSVRIKRKTPISKLVGPHGAILLDTRVLPFLAFTSYNSQTL
ncbi:hypothetical protein PIB30_068633, partial [Stylosanthes scabra]|nr:hypothetical protein [Stylosanthes scabra]